MRVSHIIFNIKDADWVTSVGVSRINVNTSAYFLSCPRIVIRLQPLLNNIAKLRNSIPQSDRDNLCSGLLCGSDGISWQLMAWAVILSIKQNQWDRASVWATDHEMVWA